MRSHYAKQAKKNFVRYVQSMSGKYSPHQIFSDFCKLARLSLANIFRDPKLDAAYNEILSKYDGKVEPFSELLTFAVDAYERETCDFLGECYEELGLSNAKAGQFFTPYDVSLLMAKVNIQKDQAQKIVAEKGYISLNDCACGAGCTLLAGLDVLKNDCGINYQLQALVIAQDIDDNCAAMCFVQLALLGAPAIVQTTDIICNPTGGTRWYTPFYWLNAHKFRVLGGVEDARKLISEPTEEPEPVPAADSEPKPDIKVDAGGQMTFDF